MKANIHQLYEMCQEIAQREETTKEQLYNGVQAIYMESCNILGKKPMTARQWERKVKKFQQKGLPAYKTSVDDMYAITTAISTADDSTNQDVMNGIKRMYELTLSKL
tara:strand:- start:391 stop:711 length:321 start_codon:yes stop_codon:yes gene_type:complete